ASFSCGPAPMKDVRSGIVSPDPTAWRPARAQAVPGHSIVLPFTLEGAARDVPVELSARLDTGRPIPTQWARVHITSEPSRTRLGWIPPSPDWEVEPITGRGSVVLMLELPADAVGHAILLGNQRLDIAWLPDPGSLGSTIVLPGARRIGDPWLPAVPPDVVRAP